MEIKRIVMNNLTDQQKKDRLRATIYGAALGVSITFLIMHLIHKKKVDKLEAKIFKLEGWQ